MKEDCKGCPSGPSCCYSIYSKHCPCSKCLVKIPCERICEELGAFTVLISRHNDARDRPISPQELYKIIEGADK